MDSLDVFSLCYLIFVYPSRTAEAFGTFGAIALAVLALYVLRKPIYRIISIVGGEMP